MSNRVTVTIRDERGGNSGGIDVSRWEVAGLTERGAVDTYTSITSLAEYKTKCGARVTYGTLYDAADEFFRDGGKEMIIARVVGEDAAAAAHTFNDGSANPAMTVTALDPGAWGNSLKVQVTAGDTGGTFVLVVSLSNVVKETSPDLADITAAIAWARDRSTYIRITDPGAVGDPAVVAATSLTGGDDDRAAIVTADWTRALDTVPRSLGAMNVSAPGATSTGVQQAVTDHADATNRFAILDTIPGGDVDDFAAQASALTGEGLKRTIIVGPWAIIPGVTASTTRTIPYSAVQAALFARADATGSTAPAVNTAAFGDDNGTADYPVGLETLFTEDDLDALDDAQIIAAKVIGGKVQTTGDRTLADPDDEPQYYQAQCARTVMYIADQALKVGGRYIGKPLDPAGVTLGFFKGDLKTILTTLGPLQVGNDPATAVSATQNLSTRRLSGTLIAQPNQSAEGADIDITVEVS